MLRCRARHVILLCFLKFLTRLGLRCAFLGFCGKHELAFWTKTPTVSADLCGCFNQWKAQSSLFSQVVHILPAVGKLCHPRWRLHHANDGPSQASDCREGPKDESQFLNVF